MENPLQINIYYDGNTNTFDDLEPIYLLKDDDRCILATSDQLRRFRGMRFEIVATMYVCPFDLEEKPEINDFIEELLVLNKYHRCHQNDSDYGSDLDSD